MDIRCGRAGVACLLPCQRRPGVRQRRDAGQPGVDMGPVGAGEEENLFFQRQLGENELQVLDEPGLRLLAVDDHALQGGEVQVPPPDVIDDPAGSANEHVRLAGQAAVLTGSIMGA